MAQKFIKKFINWKLFLTPQENDFWENLLICQQKVENEIRVGIPCDKQKLYAQWAKQKLCDLEEYWTIFQRFVKTGIIEHVVDQHNNHINHSRDRDKETYRMVPPDNFLIEKIKERRPVAVKKIKYPQQLLEIIHHIQQCHPNPQKWIRKNYPMFNQPEKAMMAIKRWQIYEKSGNQIIIASSNFEMVDLEPLRKISQHLPTRAQPSVDNLQLLSDEQLKKLLKNLQRELKRRELERKKQLLTAELAKVSTELQRLK